MPLALSSGAGAKNRKAIRAAAMGGMIAATVLAIFFVLMFFVIVCGLCRARCADAAIAQPA